MSAHTIANQYRDMLEVVLEADNAPATSALYVSAPKDFVMVGDSVRTIAVLDPVEAVQLALELLRAARLVNLEKAHRQLEERFASAGQARAALVDEAVANRVAKRQEGDVVSTPTAHNGSLDVTDGSTKYDRRKRTYRAKCSCGWASKWDTVSKRGAQSDLDAHLDPVYPATLNGESVEDES
jgi:hypothetical protein